MKSAIWQPAESNASIRGSKNFSYPRNELVTFPIDLTPRVTVHLRALSRHLPAASSRVPSILPSISKNQIKVWLLCEETYRKRPTVTFPRNFQQQNHRLLEQMARRLIIDGGEVTTAARMPAFSIQGWCRERWESTVPGKRSYERIAAICQSSRPRARIGTTRFNFLFPRFLLAGLTSLERRESRYVCHKEIATELVETRLFLSFLLLFSFSQSNNWVTFKSHRSYKLNLVFLGVLIFQPLRN